MVFKDHIKEYWQSQGQTHENSHWASWGDNWMIDLEIENISNHINEGDHVLDIGCANGHGTIRQTQLKRVGSITGVDFAESMITAAKSAAHAQKLTDTVTFLEGDVRQLEFPDATFDLAYTTRVLINLPSWEQQLLGISECLRVVKPGGAVIFSESFWEPLMRLNALRTVVGLPALTEHDYNRYLKRSKLEAYLAAAGLDYQIDDFSSVYYLGSRFLRELVTDPSAYPGYSNPINEIFHGLEKRFSGGGMGVQQAVVIRKGAK
ncbi:MAG TPA: methyltransferase domain-containing protein [Humidesulfovibrio sp.]|uniref:class I SAM-dependent methyltransferase n=1 Tax=Humidesulfovibrio sp. TaxID=2910988 RepID=UPI002C815B23|nr:methyltransferase domain-containing protein [Humidesulfovibrio sp.]HWR02660.1 methyltransferase domain-containing protein [Humidesulfovibrio sp.]